MDISVASYSFHRLLESGKQDIFGYITDCKRLGCTQLDPWVGHLPTLDKESPQLTAQEAEFVTKVRAAADQAGLPFGCVAVDGAHIYDADPAVRQQNRNKAYRWLDIAQRLGARQIRIDSGGTRELPDEMFAIIVDGYHDLLPRAQQKGLEVLIENHWGASQVPDNLVRLFGAVKGLKLLFDTNNWAEGMQQEGWQKCAKYAASVHIKSFKFDANGDDPTVDLAKAIHLLLDTGYSGCWGVESSPTDDDEYNAAAKTIALIRRVVGESSRVAK